jgi:LPXTG-motif cell wall-anchored protein
MRARRFVVATVAVVLGVLGPMTAVWADTADYPPVKVPEPKVKAVEISRPIVAAVDASRGSTLPVTGGDIAGMTAIGLGAVGLGTVLVRRSRRRPSTT